MSLTVATMAIMGGRLGMVVLAAAVLVSGVKEAQAGVTPQAAAAGLPARPVSGRLLNTNGAPLAGSAVRLDENRSTANDVLGGFMVMFSLGLSCIAGADPCRASGGASSTTAADGSFRFDAATVEQARGRSNGVIFSAGSEGAGGLRVEVDPTLGGDLGDLPLWSPQVRSGQDGFEVTIKASAPPGADGRTEVDAGVLDAQRRPVVQVTETGTEVTFVVDRRAYEDGPGTVLLTSGFSRPRANQSPRIDWTSAPVRVGRGAGAPLSRSRPCTMEVVPGGRAAPGCPLTDGDLVTDPVSGLRTAVVDLGAPHPVGLIAVRRTVERVETSADGQTYVAAPAARSRRVAWTASLYDAGGGSTRYVRITALPSSSTTPQGLSEVSVWPADAQAPPPSADRLPPSAGTSPDASGAAGAAPMALPLDDDGSSGASGPVVVAGFLAAALLLAVAAFAGGLALGRRR